MGFAGAGHAFTKIGIDDGEQGALAGPELLVKHADQDDWGDPHRRNGQAAGGRPRGAAHAAFPGQVQSSYRRHRQAHAGLLRQLQAPDLQLGRRRRALAVRGRLARAARRTKRATQLCKAGAHTRNLTLAGSNAGVLWGSEVLGFTPTQLKAIRFNAAKATFRLSRGQNAATIMMAHAQAPGAKNIDPAFRHHRQVVLAWATGV